MIIGEDSTPTLVLNDSKYNGDTQTSKQWH